MARGEAVIAPNWNINRLYADEQAMEAASDHWHELSRYRSTISTQVTKVELEAEAYWIQDSLRAVLDKNAPSKPPSVRSKR